MRVLEKRFRIQVFLGKRFDDVHNRHVDLTIQQRTGCRCGIRGKNMEAEAGIPLRQATDYGRDKSSGDCNRSSNSQFPGCWISKESNVFEALRKLVKDRDAPPQECAAILGRLDSL